MTSASAALRDRWKAAAPVAAIVGDRVFRDERPAATVLPAIRLQTISDPRPVTMKGRVMMRPTRVQVDCLARSRGEADVLAEAVINASRRPAVAGGVRFGRTFVDGLRTDSDREEGASGTLPQTIYRTSLDLTVWHQPA